MRIRSLIPVLLAALTLAIGADSSLARKRYPTLDWNLRFSAAAIYNSNLLRFSERDLDRFRDHDPAFHTPMNTLDDLENEFSIRSSFLWRAPHTMMVSGYYNLKAVRRQENSLTDYQTHTLSLGVRPRVRGYRWSARFRTFVIPSYYLRVYRDRDYGEHHAARFENWDYSGRFSYRMRGTWWMNVSGAYGTYYYNEKFTEYDSEYSEVGIGSSLALPGGFSLSADYIRRSSDNVGKDQGFERQLPTGMEILEEDSEYGDADFNEDEFNIRLRRPLTFLKFAIVDGSLSYRHRRRVYTTDRSLADDPFHRSRLDNRFQITPSITVSLVPSFEIEAYYAHEERTTESDRDSVSLAKDFVRREAGLILSYSLR